MVSSISTRGPTRPRFFSCSISRTVRARIHSGISTMEKPRRPEQINITNPLAAKLSLSLRAACRRLGQISNHRDLGTTNLTGPQCGDERARLREPASALPWAPTSPQTGRTSSHPPRKSPDYDRKHQRKPARRREYGRSTHHRNDWLGRGQKTQTPPPPPTPISNVVTEVYKFNA